MTDVPRVDLAPGYSIASIINGCWQLSPGHGGGPSSAKEIKNRFAQLVDHGLTTFDCADIYTGTEELLGEFRRSLSDGDQIQIHTKYVPNKETLGQLDDRKIDAAIDLSRKKLGTDRLDLVQFHWWDYDVPGLERMYERLLLAQSTGKIRLLGATNFNTDQLQKLVEHDASIVSVQTQFSLVDRRPEKALSPFCAENHIGLLAYGVLAGGLISENHFGKPLPDDLNRSQQKYKFIIDDAGGWDNFQQLLVLLNYIAKKHSTDMQSVASRWVLDQPGVAAIILGIGSRSRAAENQAIAAIRLDAEDRQRLNQHLTRLHRLDGDPFDLERDSGSEHFKFMKTDLQDSAAQ